uniref:Putative secreted protein n=1 Tax=Ixodes ricinus TaxID=34613 RepID=A0A6B0U2J3_IXORI
MMLIVLPGWILILHHTITIGPRANQLFMLAVCSDADHPDFCTSSKKETKLLVLNSTQAFCSLRSCVALL